jgi:hypothetical protein
MSDEPNESNDETITLARLLKDKGAPIYSSGGRIFIDIVDDKGDD